MENIHLLSLCGISVPVAILLWKLRRRLKSQRAQIEVFTKADGEHTGYGIDNPEIIIVGSGVVGSALAAVLGADGRFVTVIERDLKEPDRIVGELLQPGGVRALRSLGLERCLDDIDAQQVRGYIVHDLESHSHVGIPYPENDGQVQEGRAFHHGRFVQNLRKAAQKQDRIRYIEGTVSKLLEDPLENQISGVEYKLNDGITHELMAPLTIVCDGHFSRLRKSLVRENVKVSSHFVGLLLQNCPQYSEFHAELVLGNPSPVLIYKISEHTTRVLVDIQGTLPRNMPEYMAGTIAPQLPYHVKPSFLEAIETKVRIRSMPSSFLPPRPHYRLGGIILGDAYNMRHPLTGGGMSVGLHDVIIWRNILRNIPDCEDVQEVRKAQVRFHHSRKASHALVVNVLAQALYALFSAKDEYLRSLRKACFEYFQLGGECVAGPVGLLSVLHPRPWKLVGHFFAVAFYAVYCNFRDIRTLSALPRTLFQPVGVLFKACCVIMPLIWSELKTAFIS